MRNHKIMIEQSQAKGGLVIGQVKARRKGILTDFGASVGFPFLVQFKSRQFSFVI